MVQNNEPHTAKTKKLAIKYYLKRSFSRKSKNIYRKDTK